MIPPSSRIDAPHGTTDDGQFPVVWCSLGPRRYLPAGVESATCPPGPFDRLPGGGPQATWYPFVPAIQDFKGADSDTPGILPLTGKDDESRSSSHFHSRCLATRRASVSPGGRAAGNASSPAPLGNLRRERDSNPRYVAVHMISNHAPSTTRPSLQIDDSISAEERVGVEPTLDLRPNLISNQAPSATRPSLQGYFAHAKADRLSPDAGPVDWFRAGTVEGACRGSENRAPFWAGQYVKSGQHRPSDPGHRSGPASRSRAARIVPATRVRVASSVTVLAVELVRQMPGPHLGTCQRGGADVVEEGTWRRR
jgi:hypothetical protein